jgi:hypothetical protein
MEERKIVVQICMSRRFVPRAQYLFPGIGWRVAGGLWKVFQYFVSVNSLNYSEIVQ